MSPCKGNHKIKEGQLIRQLIDETVNRVMFSDEDSEEVDLVVNFIAD